MEIYLWVSGVLTYLVIGFFFGVWLTRDDVEPDTAGLCGIMVLWGIMVIGGLIALPFFAGYKAIEWAHLHMVDK